MTVTTERRLSDFAGYARTRPRKFLLLSSLFGVAYLALLAPLLLLLPYVVWSLVELLRDAWGNPLAAVGVLLFIVLIVPFVSGIYVHALLYYAVVEICGRLCRRFGVDATRALGRAGAEPILYLRAFYHENFDRSPAGKQAKYGLFEKENDDEVLALALREDGPFVAVGRPDDMVPPLGAIRLYFSDGEWHARVAELMKISRLTFIQPGYSGGLEAEMELAEKLPPEKVIYSLLAWQHHGRERRELEYETFSMQVKRIYKCPLPEKIGNAYFLYFTKGAPGGEGGWTPHMVGLGGWKRVFFGVCSSPNVLIRVLNSDLVVLLMRFVAPFAMPLIRRLPAPRLFRAFSTPAVREALRPVLAARGMHLSVWRTALFVTLVSAVPCVMVGASLNEDLGAGLSNLVDKFYSHLGRLASVLYAIMF